MPVLESVIINVLVSSTLIPAQPSAPRKVFVPKTVRYTVAPFSMRIALTEISLLLLIVTPERVISATTPSPETLKFSSACAM